MFLADKAYNAVVTKLDVVVVAVVDDEEVGVTFAGTLVWETTCCQPSTFVQSFVIGRKDHMISATVVKFQLVYFPRGTFSSTQYTYQCNDTLAFPSVPSAVFFTTRDTALWVQLSTDSKDTVTRD